MVTVVQLMFLLSRECAVLELVGQVAKGTQFIVLETVTCRLCGNTATQSLKLHNLCSLYKAGTEFGDSPTGCQCHARLALLRTMHINKTLKSQIATSLAITIQSCLYKAKLQSAVCSQQTACLAIQLCSFRFSSDRDCLCKHTHTQTINSHRRYILLV